MPKLTDYKNFWLIWLSAAGRPQGISLFTIQNEWGIKTNYLYHEEAGLGKPLYVTMIRDGYLIKEGRKIKVKFDWITDFIKERYQPSGFVDYWIPYRIIGSKWPDVQSFIEKHSSVLFDPKNLRILYRNNKDILGDCGQHIFTDIFIYVLFSNLIVFCKKYKAEIVLRILLTAFSMFTERDIMNYMRQIHSQIGKEVPLIIKDEAEMNALMSPFNWG
ncbi:MAG: hypothetical protein QXN71_02235 [Candidatus Aenigmatarchaeota archaeon]